MLIKDAQNLLEGRDRFFVSDISHEPDGYMVLMVNTEDVEGYDHVYYGVNVLFDKDKNFKDFATADKQADDEAVKYKDELIALAKKALK